MHTALFVRNRFRLCDNFDEGIYLKELAVNIDGDNLMLYKQGLSRCRRTSISLTNAEIRKSILLVEGSVKRQI